MRHQLAAAAVLALLTATAGCGDDGCVEPAGIYRRTNRYTADTCDVRAGKPLEEVFVVDFDAPATPTPDGCRLVAEVDAATCAAEVEMSCSPTDTRAGGKMTGVIRWARDASRGEGIATYRWDDGCVLTVEVTYSRP